jgi:hypothetical protein
VGTFREIGHDGHRAYLTAVENTFGADVDYAMLVKLFAEAHTGQGNERKYSPGECCGTRKEAMIVFDFTLGTHPISRKGTTEFGRSEATKRFWLFSLTLHGFSIVICSL